MAAIFCLLTGCGTQSYDEAFASSIGTLKDAINTYNSTPVSDVSSTGAACTTARDAIQGSPPPARPQGRFDMREQSTRGAYQAALKGFTDCAQAASTQNYLLMAQADQELAQANLALREIQSPPR